ncbi:zinc CCCH type domain-containing protein [Cryptosporidium andersoni]|uniref:Zinc CCCH type domain-containing protein n=1 Tax=Cryptosporidium andersoni TaxID=117008 RepID=A0A1J4MVY9_9CRYT|nr:zinc CCCH type domain-containing protein [Cryptosporidium andersoni]
MACPRLLSDSDLCRFRTKSCRRSKQLGCDFGVTRCQYSHNVYWPRRCPFYLSNANTIRYIPVLCPDITIKDDESSISRCTRGGGCPFAHSYEEINYHPLMYKTRICEQFQRGDCTTYYCHLIHGLAERRETKIYILPYTQNIDVPDYPGVIIASKIDKQQSGKSSISMFLSKDNIDNYKSFNRKWSERILDEDSKGQCEFLNEKENIGCEDKNSNLINVIRALVMDDDDKGNASINTEQLLSKDLDNSKTSRLSCYNSDSKFRDSEDFSSKVPNQYFSDENSNSSNFFTRR